MARKWNHKMKCGPFEWNVPWVNAVNAAQLISRIYSINDRIDGTPVLQGHRQKLYLKSSHILWQSYLLIWNCNDFMSAPTWHRRRLHLPMTKTNSLERTMQHGQKNTMVNHSEWTTLRAPLLIPNTNSYELPTGYTHHWRYHWRIVAPPLTDITVAADGRSFVPAAISSAVDDNRPHPTELPQSNATVCSVVKFF